MDGSKNKLPKMSDAKARALAEAMALLKEGDSAMLDALVQGALQSQPLDIPDLWEPTELPMTYWILLLSGVNQPDECEIAKTIVFWNALFSKHSAKVMCVQSSERTCWRLSTEAFGVTNYPGLILSDSPDGNPFIRFGPDFLFSLLNQEGGLQRFLTKVHALVEGGFSLQNIASQFAAEKFWRQIKLAYKEVKDLVSVSISFEPAAGSGGNKG